MMPWSSQTDFDSLWSMALEIVIFLSNNRMVSFRKRHDILDPYGHAVKNEVHNKEI